MSPLEEAVHEVARLLESRRVPYMVIGGVANLVWGVPRSTGDVDVTLWVEEEAREGFVRDVASELEVLVEDPVAFVERTRVLPARTRSGFRADLVFGLLAYEKEAIDRARPVEFAGLRVRICTAEDLVLHKLASERARDREDVRGILETQGARLDRGYLDRRVEALSRDLDRPDILEFYRRVVRARSR